MSGVKKKIPASSFYVIDVEDPTAPVLEDTLSIGANPFSMAVSGNYAYVVDLVTGLEVIDLGLNHPLGIDPATGGMQRSHDHAAAWKHVGKRSKACGINGVKAEDILDKEGGVETFLDTIHEELKSRGYRPSPVKCVYIAKANGKERPLGQHRPQGIPAERLRHG